MSEIILSLTTIAMSVSLVVSIVLCVCRNKSKTNSTLSRNSNNLLPLNSIRSSDLQTYRTSDLELIRYNGVNCLPSADDADNHLRHTQRALPDIPSVANSGHPLPANEFDLSLNSVEPNESHHKIEPIVRSSKARAPQPPTHRLMSSQTVTTSDDLHHSYARIKDNVIIDSSENETDDYYDPHFRIGTSARGMGAMGSHKSDDMSPPVPSKRFANDLNNDLGFNGTNPSTSRVAAEEVAYLSSTPVLHSNVDAFSNGSNEENRMNGNKSEISYNTISVREPLAKVLAERANSEHHYNEVEEERVSSFYEEIAGSTASSVTYSKIGDVLSSDNTIPQNSTQETQTERTSTYREPVVHSMDTTDSACAAPDQSFAKITHNCDSLLANNYPKDLYSSVDKKSKTKSYNRQTIHCIPDSDNEFDNLYAKVQKQVNNSPKNRTTVYTNQRPSSGSEFDSGLLPDTSIPPPLPPPLKSFQTSQSRSARTISLYDSFQKANTSSHQRRYSSGNQSIDASNDWHKRDLNNDYFDYGIVGTNRMEMDLESDPGYEVIHKKTPTTQPPISAALMNGVHSVPVGVDPGYEAIGYDESDFDPNYETITKKVNKNTDQTNETEITDPGYEVIKRVPQNQTQTQTYSSTRFELNISRNVSDLSSEPGYERIRFTQRSEQIESEPNYASISRRIEFYEEEDDEDGDQTISERL